VEDALATTVYATLCSVSLRSLGTSPGNLIYHHDMFVDLPIVANLIQIRDRRQQLIGENLWRQNAKRREYRYAVRKRSVDQVSRSYEDGIQGSWTLCYTAGVY
jgi:hypothetical protein